MTSIEQDVVVSDGSLRVREVGDRHGYPVLYFHGTPGSRLDLSFGEDVLREQNIRLVSFDRPGYGQSSPAPYGLSSLARGALEVADFLELDGFATLGLSGGGPFALATAAVGRDRITAAGVASGAGPFQLVPDALAQLDENDRAAEAHLPDNPEAAAAGFAAGFQQLAELLRSGDDASVAEAFAPLLTQRDLFLLGDDAIGPNVIASMREGLSQGVSGGGWDNVAWIGAWDFDIGEVRCPVLLWYGKEDMMAPLAHGVWLQEHLPDARLVQRAGEGHFGLVDHLRESLRSLVDLATG